MSLYLYDILCHYAKHLLRFWDVAHDFAFRERKALKGIAVDWPRSIQIHHKKNEKVTIIIRREILII